MLFNFGKPKPEKLVDSEPKEVVAAGNDEKLKLSLGLVIGIWLLGLFGSRTKLKEWPALYLYVFGTFGLTAYEFKKNKGGKSFNFTRENLPQALMLGGLLGSCLFGMDVMNTYKYYKKGGAPMKEMEDILIKQKFVALFPVLIVAEECLWRGLLYSALEERGMNKHKVIAITNLLYTLNHFAVAPVGMKERAMMAGMAVPIGFVNGYLTLKTKNLWSGVLAHFMTMISMVADILIIPGMARRARENQAQKERVVV